MTLLLCSDYCTLRPFVPYLKSHSILSLRNSYLFLFCNTLTSPLCDIRRDCKILKVGQLANIPPQVEEGVIEGVSR